MNDPETLPAPAACNDPAHRVQLDAACAGCGSPDVELVFPAFFRASDGRLMIVGISGAPDWAWCGVCRSRVELEYAP